MSAVPPPADYRAFLRRWVAAHRSRSQRGLARRLGVAPSLVNMVLKGRRNVQLEDVERWVEAMRLEDDEADRFRTLVQMAHAPTAEQRRAAANRLEALDAFASARAISSPDLALLLRPMVAVLAELARCVGFRPEPGWIARRLRRTPSEDEVREALDVLIANEVLRQRPDGSWTLDERPIATAVRVQQRVVAEAVAEQHRVFLRDAADALSLPADQRHLSLLTVAIPRARLPELFRAAARMQLELVEPLRGEPADQVVQIGVQIVPATDPTAE